MPTKEEEKKIDTTAKDGEEKKEKKEDILKDEKGKPLTESDIKLFKR